MLATKFHFFLLIIFSFLIFFCFSYVAQADKNPKGFVFPISKNGTTNQYNIYISMGEDYQTFWYVALDLGGQYLLLGCDDVGVASYRPIRCGSTKCRAAKGTGCVGCNSTPRPGCTNNTCGIFAYNPLTDVLVAEGLGEGVLTVASTDGTQRLSKYEIPRAAYSCVGSSLLEGLSKGALAGVGIAGLARTETSLHEQVSKAFRLPRKFALCLPTSDGIQGDLFVSEGPYYLPPYAGDVTKILLKTRLVINPVSTAPVYSEGDPSDEYFIDVESVRIDGKTVPISPSLLAIDKKGVGGTKLSTSAPYTVLHSSIYKAIANEFVKKADSMRIKRVASSKPFGSCFSANTIANSKTGPVVPKIDLVFQSEEVHWRIHGHNSMVKVSRNVMCLAFVDGGSKVRTSIVLGGYQLEDNFVQFDLDSSRFGFSNSLLLRSTNCSHLRSF